MDEFAPLFAHKEPGPRFKTSEAAGIIAEPGMAVESVANQLRGYIRDGHVQIREWRGTGKVRHALLSLSDLTVAKVLLILNHDYGIFDPQILGFTSAAFYGWQDGDSTPKAERFPHPAFNVVRDTARGQEWVFRLDVSRHLKDGRRSFQTYLFNLAGRMPERDDPSGAMPRGSLMLNLGPHLRPILEAGERKAKAN